MKGFIFRHKNALLLILSGFLTALPLIITELGFLQWISVALAAWVLIPIAENSEVKYRKLYGLGVLFFSAYYATAFHWFFYMYPLDFAGLSNAASIAVVLVACFGLGIFQGVQSALIFVLFGKIARTKAAMMHKLIIPFSAASLWVIFEWCQTFGWWGVPWARLPLGQIDASLVVRSASLFGSYFVTFVVVSVAFCFVLAIKQKNKERLFAYTALGIFCFNLLLGFAVTLTYTESEKTVKVAAVQGNISSSEKWDDDSKDKTLSAYRELTEKAANDGAEIIVWPETALPYVLFDSSSITQFVSDLARDNEVTILASAFTVDSESGQRYNSIIEVRPDGSFGENIYSKQRLVPFGEFVPMREFVTFIFPPLANIGMLEDDLLAGEESIVIDSERGKIGCVICFDSIYEDIVIDSVRNGAELIAVSTNDSWFSDSAALDMHNAQARFRAIENGRCVVRSANTGISSIIDPLGNVDKELGALERGYLTCEVELRENLTLYSIIGNLFVYCCMAYIACVCIWDLLNIKFFKKS